MSHESLYDIEAEQMLLGGLLQKPDLLDEVQTVTKADDFYYHSHRLIFTGMLYLHGRNMLDFKTLVNLLQTRNKLAEIGGLDYLIKLRSSVPTLHLAKFYAERVKELSIYRQAFEIGQRLQTMAVERDGGLDEFIASVHQQFNQFNPVQRNTLTNVRTAIEEQTRKVVSGEVVRSPLIGLSTVDHWMNGIGRDRLIVIAGRPGTGKTAFALHILRHVAQQDFGPPVMFSLEMQHDELMARMQADLAGVSFSRIMRRDLDDDQKRRVLAAEKILSQHDFYIDDAPRMDMAYISAVSRRLKREHGQLGVVLIDYLGLIELHQGRNETKTDAIGRVTKEAKQLARELGCSVILLHQMNREIEKRANKRPILSDLRDSGSIEQDADMVIFLHKDEEKSKDLEAHIDMIVAKGRQTGIADFELKFLGAIQRYQVKVEV